MRHHVESEQQIIHMSGLFQRMLIHRIRHTIVLDA